MGFFFLLGLKMVVDFLFAFAFVFVFVFVFVKAFSAGRVWDSSEMSTQSSSPGLLLSMVVTNEDKYD